MYLSFSRLEDYLDHLKFIGEPMTRIDWHEKTTQTEIEFLKRHHVYAVLTSLQYNANHQPEIIICQVKIGEVDSLQLKVNGSKFKELSQSFDLFCKSVKDKKFTVLPGFWSAENPVK